MNQETFKAVYTVILPNGHELKHEFIMPANLKEAMAFVGDVGKMIGIALARGKILVLQNPAAVYNVSNISGIRAQFIGPQELKEAAEKATRTMGFTIK
jgi:hypothetical protein